MKEANLYPMLTKGALCDGWLLYKINDMALGEKPFDIMGLADSGIAVGLEVKVIPKLDINEPIPIRVFKPHQLEWLMGFTRRGGMGAAVFYVLSSGNTHVVEVTSNLAAPVHTLRRFQLIQSDFARGHVLRGWHQSWVSAHTIERGPGNTVTGSWDPGQYVCYDEKPS